MIEGDKRWHVAAHGGWFVKAPGVEAFLSDVASTCRRHGYDIQACGDLLRIQLLPEGQEPECLGMSEIGETVPFDASTVESVSSRDGK